MQASHGESGLSKTTIGIIVPVFVFVLGFVLFFYNQGVGLWKYPLVALPVVFLMAGFIPVQWPKSFSKAKITTIWMLVWAALGFVFIILQPDRFGIFIGMVSFLISKIYFLKNLRLINGYIEINTPQRWLAVSVIAGGFFLFFIFLLLNEVDPLHLFPIFLYVFVDTLILYSAERVVELKKHAVLGLLAIFSQVIFDIVCSFSIFIPLIKDNYTSSLLVGYTSYFFTILYLYLITRKKGVSTPKNYLS